MIGERLTSGGAQSSPEVARELISSHFDVSPYEHINQLEEIGRAKAQAEGVAYQMEHERKIIWRLLVTSH